MRCDLILKREISYTTALALLKKKNEKTDKKKIQKGRHFSSKSHTYPLRAKTNSFRGSIKKTQDMDGTLPFILSLFFQSLVFSLLIFVLRLDFCMRSSIFEYIFPTRGVSLSTHLSPFLMRCFHRNTIHRRRGVPHEPERRSRRGRVRYSRRF